MVSIASKKRKKTSRVLLSDKEKIETINQETAVSVSV
jgi:hypothetical protein